MTHDLNNVTNRTFDPDKIAYEVAQSGSEYADAECVASNLEELKKVVLSELKLTSGEKSDAARETAALASLEYRTHIDGMCQARKLANRKKARYLTLKLWAELKRTEQSNMRAEMEMR